MSVWYDLTNIPALRAKGLHRGELNTRARSALVIEEETGELTHSPTFQLWRFFSHDHVMMITLLADDGWIMDGDIHGNEM